MDHGVTISSSTPINRSAGTSTSAGGTSSSSSQLQARVATLEEHVLQMEQQRREMLERRRWNLLIVGASLSLLVHLSILFYLNNVYRGGHAGPGTSETTFEFAIDDSEGLSDFEGGGGMDDLVPEVAGVDVSEATEVSTDLNPAIPSMERVSANSLTASLTGANGGSGGGGDGGAGTGSGEGMGLGGGGGGTSFFGVSSKGTRFAFIVDVSGSMEIDRKLQTAMKELARAIDSLPDTAQYYVVLFSSGITQPPGQKGWTRARKTAVRTLIRWLGMVDPGGGTEPQPAFIQVFSLDVRPDVIFFLTDGEVQNFTAEECANLNSSGRRAIINTIAFGDPSSQAMLKKIAADSGGTYKFVTSGAGP